MKLEVQNIEKSFGEKQVLKGLSFSVESGKALGLLGRNGAGKTTTIRTIMGVLPADGGQILLDGAPFVREQVKIGYLPEERGMYAKKVILEQLIYFGMLTGMTKAAAKTSATQLLERLGMSEYTHKKLDTLSKGNQQKIQLIATLLNDPDIVILDEPFSGLDPVNALLLKDIVLEIIARGKIVLFSSHQMHSIEEFCEEIAIINQGDCVLKGNLKDIKRAYPRNVLNIQSENQSAVASFSAALTYVQQVEEKGATLFVTLENDTLKNQYIADIMKNGLDFTHISVFEPSLNDIFVSYTEGNA